MWYIYFKRIALSVFGIFLVGMLAMLLVLWNILPSRADAQTATIEFPFLIPGTDLIAEYFVSYEGDFFEDGSGEFVIDNAALCVYNRGETYIDFAAIHIQTEEQDYHFEGTCIPPHAKVVILEKDKKTHTKSDVRYAEGHTVISIKESVADHLRIENKGMVQLKVTNQGNLPLENIRLYYKRYDTQWGIYVGGVTYATPVGDLLPGESIVISPACYVNGYCKVFCATES